MRIECLRVLLFGLFSLVVLPAPGAGERSQPIRIGAVLHLTGDLAMQSHAFLEGIELAVSEINRQGEPGEKIELIVEDGKNSASSSNAAARKLVSVDKVNAAIISSHLDAMSSGSVYERAGIPAIVIWDASPEIEEIGSNLFAIGPWIPSSGQAAARFSTRKFSAKTAVVVKSQDPFSDTAFESFQNELERCGGRVVRDFAVAPGLTDFRSIIARLKRLDPDVVYSPLVYNMVPFYRQLREQGFSKPVISCNIITEEHISQAPSAFEGVYHTMIQDPADSAFRTLAAAYRRKYGKEPTQKWFIGIGYDAMKLIAEAISSRGSAPDEVREGLYAIRDFEGVTATFSISQRGSSPQYERVFQIVNGEFVLMEG